MLWGPDDWDTWTSTRAASGAPSTRSEIILDTLKKLPGRKRMTVADLGCGRGSLLPFLVEQFGRVYAIDYAPASLAEARRAHPGLGIVFRRRDLRDLTPLRGRLHVALAVDSIVGPRAEDVDRILEQVHQSLVEGGIFLATFPAASRSGPPVAFPLPAARAEGERAPGFTETELQYRLRRAGFRGVRMRRLSAGSDAPERLLSVATRRASN
jgi:SAM-dependent methyltransferase